MKRTISIYFIIGLVPFLCGCRRNYKVVHVRPAVDSTVITDNNTAESDPLAEPLMDIPAPPQEGDFTKIDPKARKEYDDYMKGL